ncbi:MAG TPA: RING finger domain-containing protein [Rhabdochlamydiaceae bacterium]|nr:RING finger domain-containing protein [Rhabdochlamydiaceae bacterium]
MSVQSNTLVNNQQIPFAIEIQEKPECSICLEEVTTDDKIQLACNHLFHPKCLNDWWIDKDECTCPYCREVIIKAPPLESRVSVDSGANAIHQRRRVRVSNANMDRVTQTLRKIAIAFFSFLFITGAVLLLHMLLSPLLFVVILGLTLYLLCVVGLAYAAKKKLLDS